MIKSRFHWLTIILFFLALILGLLVFRISIALVLTNPGSFKYLLSNLFLGTIEYSAVIAVIIYAKTVTVTGDLIHINFILTRRTVSLLISDIQGYHRNKHFHPTFGKYGSFDILTKQGKLYIIYSYEFSNYSTLTNKIAAGANPISVRKWNYWKNVIKLAVCSFLLAYATISTIMIIHNR